MSRNTVWIGFQTVLYECSSKQICKNQISCSSLPFRLSKCVRISNGFAQKLDVGWKSEQSWTKSSCFFFVFFSFYRKGQLWHFAKHFLLWIQWQGFKLNILKLSPQNTQHLSSQMYSVNTLSSFSVAGGASQLFCDHYARISVEASVGTAGPQRQLPRAGCSLRTMEDRQIFLP